MLPYGSIVLYEQETSQVLMVSAKRVILANGSRLLRDMLHRVMDKIDQLEIVKDVPGWEELPAALESLEPEWVIVPESAGNASHPQIDFCLQRYPSVRFVFLSPKQNNIKMRWQMSYEAEFTDLSLKEFIHILKKDLQQT